MNSKWRTGKRKGKKSRKDAYDGQNDQRPIPHKLSSSHGIESESTLERYTTRESFMRLFPANGKKNHFITSCWGKLIFLFLESRYIIWLNNNSKLLK